MDHPINQLSQLIVERTGIALHPQQYDVLEETLNGQFSADPYAYIQHLRQSNTTDDKWQQLIHAVTIGETYFLRERAHFDILRNDILPKLIADRRKNNRLTLNIWSTGCATGEEPYSIAITLHELIPDIDNWKINLIGTDINAKALHLARKGVYRKWAFRHTNIDFQGQYFDHTSDGLQIKPEIKRLVNFRQANLFNGPPLSEFDVILCRNVLLYFDRHHVKAGEHILYDALNPGGWLILGHSETIHTMQDRWLSQVYPGLPLFQKPYQGVIYQNRKTYTKRTTQTQRIVVAGTYEDAVVALQNDQTSRAEKLLKKLLKEDRHHAAAHVMMAYIHANRNKFPAAHQEIDLALLVDPLLADAHYLRASLFIEDGRKDEAFEALRSALYCQRNHPLASFMMGNLYAQNGDIAKANKHWENARQTVRSLIYDSPVSDISDITAGQLSSLIQDQLEGWQA